ncbi:ABC transporter permease [Sphingomonas sp. LY29]|uniref:ABC transporter permease n=1 Tax=unclassified Sphingomonas TaxID=196159 RepID=UPI002D77C2CB|nr:ABC transporter permease [Sphingomonas sp. LY29]WRP25322.1 ABC transporter permease [Sphingomonas sp. LY29]
MIRELVTRYGRENIGFLWIMVEPLLFAVLVGVMWRAMKGPEDHGVSVIAFVASGYIPITLFRHAVSRSVRVFTVNSSLMYHRQIKVLDFITVRFLVELIGAMMAYFFIVLILMQIGEFPVPDDLGKLLAGWFLYAFFCFSLCLILAPLSEKSDVLEKIIPVSTYIMIPFSGTFNMNAWLTPEAQAVMWYSPFVHAMEMMREGIFGQSVNAMYDWQMPFWTSVVCALIGLAMCRRVRRHLVVE